MLQQLRNRHKGQSIVEYAVLIVIVLAVFFVMQTYIKRGIQGRWKTSVDDLGEQYDPRYVNGSMLYTYESVSNTEIHTIPGSVAGQGGYWTNRVDSSTSTEIKRGTMRVGTPGCAKDDKC